MAHRAGRRRSLTQEFYWGINDPLGADPSGRPFNPTVFTLYDAWQSSDPSGGGREEAAARAAIARGQDLFNHRSLSIVGVSGLNDDLGVAVHSRDVHHLPRHPECREPFGAGATADRRGRARAGGRPERLRPADLHAAQPEHRRGPADHRPGPGADHRPVEGHRSLQGADAAGRGRPRARTSTTARRSGLEDVIAFYDARFRIGLTEQEKVDLLAFLAAL